MNQNRPPDSKPFEPSEPQKTKGLRDVRYELGMMAECTLGLHLPFAPAPLLESLLLHVRSLREFFESVKREQDDILSMDYGFDRSVLNLPSEMRTLLNKDLAHLSYSRSGPMWEFRKFLPPIVKKGLEFSNFILEGKGRKYLDADEKRDEQILLWEDTRSKLTILAGAFGEL